MEDPLSRVVLIKFVGWKWHNVDSELDKRFILQWKHLSSAKLHTGTHVYSQANNLSETDNLLLTLFLVEYGFSTNVVSFQLLTLQWLEHLRDNLQAAIGNGSSCLIRQRVQTNFHQSFRRLQLAIQFACQHQWWNLFHFTLLFYKQLKHKTDRKAGGSPQFSRTEHRATILSYLDNQAFTCAPCVGITWLNRNLRSAWGQRIKTRSHTPAGSNVQDAVGFCPKHFQFFLKCCLHWRKCTTLPILEAVKQPEQNWKTIWRIPNHKETWSKETKK